MISRPHLLIIILALTFSTLSHTHATDGAKPTAAQPEPEWKISMLHIKKGVVSAYLTNTSATPPLKRVILYSNSKDETNRLLSSTFSMETGDVHVEGMLDGKRLSLSQKLDELDDSPLPPIKTSPNGPSEEDRKKYESLTDRGREKFRDQLREKFTDEKFRNATAEERRNAIHELFEKIEKEDKGGK